MRSSFGIRHSSFLRHSDFVIRHSSITLWNISSSDSSSRSRPRRTTPWLSASAKKARVNQPGGTATRTFFALADNHGVVLRGLERDDETLEELFYRVVGR